MIKFKVAALAARCCKKPLIHRAFCVLRARPSRIRRAFAARASMLREDATTDAALCVARCEYTVG
jgi:hypothetical protein